MVYTFFGYETSTQTQTCKIQFATTDTVRLLLYPWSFQMLKSNKKITWRDLQLLLYKFYNATQDCEKQNDMK